MRVVYATDSRVIRMAGQVVRVRAGEPWDADDPVVLAHKDGSLFSDGPPAVRSTRDPRGMREFEPERTTAAPGERRMTPRKGGKQAKPGTDE